MEAVDQENPLDEETRNEEEKSIMIHLLQTPDPVRYGNKNKIYKMSYMWEGTSIRILLEELMCQWFAGHVYISQLETVAT